MNHSGTATEPLQAATDLARAGRSSEGSADRVYDVAVVGFGPSGEAAANFAGVLGLRTVVIERDARVFPRQRAIALDDEVMRIFQSIGLVEPIRTVRPDHMVCGTEAAGVALQPPHVAASVRSDAPTLAPGWLIGRTRLRSGIRGGGSQ
jgi:2-polyprenyl-6-methoxyphenol hydroxylase-like FAD-dependent oxidoreductase